MAWGTGHGWFLSTFQYLKYVCGLLDEKSFQIQNFQLKSFSKYYVYCDPSNQSERKRQNEKEKGRGKVVIRGWGERETKQGREMGREKLGARWGDKEGNRDTKEQERKGIKMRKGKGRQGGSVG